MAELHKRYLGDGVYIQLGSFHGEFQLTTEDGVSIQNSIVMGPQEIDAMLRYVCERLNLKFCEFVPLEKKDAACDHSRYRLEPHPDGGEQPWCPACQEFVEL